MSEIFKVGQKFHSYSAVEKSLKDYEEQTFAKFWKRDARLINSSRTLRRIREPLKYEEVKFCCIYGGQKFRPSGSGQKEIRTFKKEELCPAHVSLRVTTDGKDLQVRSVSDNHNHERSMVQFQYLCQQRRLGRKAKETVEELPAMQANKMLVKQKLQQETGKMLTLKDLSKNGGQKSEKNLDECVDVLRTQYNAEVNILKDEDNNFKGMLIQTSNMKNTLKAYPEFLGIDGTYKLVNIDIPVFLIVSEDGNCQTEIVSFCLLTTADKDSFTWFLETFKANNPQTRFTKCIMADKDLLEKTVIKDKFPDANVNICIFHSMQIFSRAITCEKMSITHAERVKSLKILQKMVYSETEEEFEQLHYLLKISAPKPVTEYFDKNWYPVKDEWSLSKSFIKGCFQNTTNNHIEKINAKLKSVINKNSSLVQFMHSFFTIMSSLESEHDFKAISQLQKRLVTSYSPESDEQKYLDFLTNEAGKIVIKQIELSKKIQVPSVENNGINSTEGRQTCDPTNCTCNFKTSMLLPCRHIFAIRKRLELPLFLKELVHKRWTLDYYKICHRRLAQCPVFDTDIETSEAPNVVVANKNNTKIYEQKRKEVLSVMESLVNLVAISSNDSFDQKMDNLKTLEMLWKQGSRTGIVIIKEEDEGELPLENLNEQVIIKEEDEADEGELPLVNLNEIDEGKRTRPVMIKEENEADESEFHLVNSNELVMIKEEDDADEDELPLNLNEIAPDESNEDTIIQEPTISEVASIKISPKIKERGRPRGSELTTAGLPKRQKLHVPFPKLTLEPKQKKILGWFVSDEVVALAINERLIIEEKYVETRPENIPHAVLHENVDMNIVRNFFSDTAWSVVENVIALKRQNKLLCN